MRKMRLKQGGTLRRSPLAPCYSMRERSSLLSRATVRRVLDYEEHPREHTMCFTGHRELDEQEVIDIEDTLDNLLPIFYRKGYRTFLVGAARGFDMLVLEALKRLRWRYKDFKVVTVLPCATQSRLWAPEDSQRYERNLYSSDEIRVLSSRYYKGCMQVRNQHMVNRSSMCVCYLKKMKGGTVSTVAYAMQQHVPIFNIAIEDACYAYIEQND